MPDELAAYQAYFGSKSSASPSDQDITLPALPGEATAPHILVSFPTPLYVEKFSVGVDQNGNPTQDGLKIDLGGIFSVEGNVSFTRNPDGSVDVNIPSAQVKRRVGIRG